MLWDLFGRVIDNFGDVGVCWRLAAGLAARGERVRLWLDDPAALAWMAPAGAAGVQVRRWDSDLPEPGEVVVEAFGCDPPPAFVARMAARRPAPVWLNLEYLSAEDYVERSHGLASPQSGGPGAGLTKWFFYPGFTPRTGGLLRGAEPPADRRAWLAERGWAPRADESVVLLFCYDNPALPALLRQLAAAPTLLLAAPGPAQRQLAGCALPATLRTLALPWLPQADFDRLLACTDLNLVRGEDSFVQAQWPGVPFIWQIYPQHDGAHEAKLEAFLDRFAQATDFRQAPALRRCWRAWNGLADWPGPGPEHWPEIAAWRDATLTWRKTLLSQPDLVTQLQRFAADKR